MNANVLVIEENISAAISLKNALEATRQFQVYPFANVQAALEHTQSNRIDIAILSMHITDFPGERLLLSIRDVAPNTVIIASTSDSKLATQATSMGATGLVPKHYTARDVLSVLEQIAPHLVDESVLPTASQVAIDPSPSKEELAAPTSLEDTMGDVTVFEKLSAEEPPLPNFKQGGTITTYMMQVTDSELNNLLSSISEVMNPVGDFNGAPLSGDIDQNELKEQETQADTPAQFILEDIAGETMPLEATPFEVYLERVRGQEPNNPLDEPDFLHDGVLLEDPLLDDGFIQTTQASEAERELIQEDTDNPETLTVQSESLADIDLQPTNTNQTVAVPPEDDPILEQFTSSAERWNWGDEEIAPLPTDADPRITQMAVSLTQASLESTADGTLLTQNGEIIAYEGELLDEDIEEILQELVNYPADIKKQQGRVQFITLKSNSLNYLIYSRRTDEDYLLSMVFEGNTAMTDIRQQADRIASALEAVPQLSPEDLMLHSGDEVVTEDDNLTSKGGMRLEATPAVDVGPLTKYTFLWLPRDPEFVLTYETTEAIDSGLRIQLVERGWDIDVVEVQGDYVYVVAGIPGDEPPQSIVRNLQKRAAKIAKLVMSSIETDTLWAESYFILTPGRSLKVQEIQQYINFYRM